MINMNACTVPLLGAMLIGRGWGVEREREREGWANADLFFVSICLGERGGGGAGCLWPMIHTLFLFAV